GRVHVVRRDALGVHRPGPVAGDVDPAGRAGGEEGAVLHDLFGGRVVRALRVGERHRVEAPVDQSGPAPADLVDLRLVVGRGLEVDVVDRVATDVLAVVGERGDLRPRHRATDGTDLTGDDVERAVDAVRLQRVLPADPVLVGDPTPLQDTVVLGGVVSVVSTR